MRSNPTPAEAKLWKVLRKRQILNVRFRRQHPIDPYIVDFYAPQIKLVIEVDGGQHIGMTDYDQYRTDYLEEKGYHVLRFWNNQIMSDLHGVVLEIIRVIDEINGKKKIRVNFFTPSQPPPESGDSRGGEEILPHEIG